MTAIILGWVAIITAAVFTGIAVTSYLREGRERGGFRRWFDDWCAETKEILSPPPSPAVPVQEAPKASREWWLDAHERRPLPVNIYEPARHASVTGAAPWAEDAPSQGTNYTGFHAEQLFQKLIGRGAK